MYIIIVLTLS